MAQLTKSELLKIVRNGFTTTDWMVTSCTDVHPFEVEMQGPEGVCRIRIYVWNVTHGGKSRSADEFRILTGLPAGVWPVRAELGEAGLAAGSGCAPPASISPLSAPSY